MFSSTTVRTCLIAGLAVLLGAGCTTADLRTEELKTQGLTDQAIKQGRTLLHEVAVHQGLGAWRAHATLQYEAVDHWAWGWLSQEWWPANSQRFRAQMLLGTFTSRVEFLDGPENGAVWGIQRWQAYTQADSSARARRSASEAIAFYLPTLHYFMELPFRLLTADIVAYAGERMLDGRTYDLVFVTWGDFAPSLQHDQYMLWIDRATRRIAVAHYTLRDAFDWATGTIHFGDYRTVQGVALPFRQTVTLASPEATKRPLDEHYFHQIVIESAQFDALAPEALVIDTLGTPGDAKPAAYNPLNPLDGPGQ